MRVEINENINKTKKWVTLKMSEKDEILSFEKFEGRNCMQELEQVLEKLSIQLKQADGLDYYIKNQGLQYLSYFPSIETLNIIGGRQLLYFPKTDELKELKVVHINQQSHPTELKGIANHQTLTRLYIGDFTFGKPIQLTGLDEIVKLNNLEELFLSNVRLDFEELYKLRTIRSLKKLTLNQRYRFEEFAELSVLLPNLESKELKPWQSCITDNGDIKINGKRKPYLDSKIDQEKIEEYERQFEMVRKKYLS